MIVTALSLVSAPISVRQQRHLAFISEFNVQMLYLPDLKNAIANFLSHPPPSPEPSGTVAAAVEPDPVDFKAMATEQNHCAEMQHLLCSSSFKLAFRQAGIQRLFGDVSTGVFYPIVPATLRKDIFLHLHSISHTAGRLASQRLVSSWFVWRGLTNDITSWAKSCLHCQRSKIHRHTRLLPQPIPIHQRGFAHLHIDLVGPLQYSSGCNHIFTIIDRTSKWMEAIALSETSAEACARALVFS
jgi:hypothetical protein